MESLQVAVDWILRLGIILLVPAAVWVVVILGLILIVRDKVHQEETTLPEPRHPKTYTFTCCGKKSGRSDLPVAPRERPGLAAREQVAGMTHQSKPNHLRTVQAIHSEKELRP